ncbi:hypothetical protein T01_2705 [Trichinella spiralis]|uniref:Uncharacterized protein n=1 Tax=Trichinella spiralis TaxID=6334 RepID=A0A0V1C0J5_TRISP|nr:hypothetical protein T01_2705 [Trichinella spiralis]
MIMLTDVVFSSQLADNQSFSKFKLKSTVILYLFLNGAENAA